MTTEHTTYHSQIVRALSKFGHNGTAVPDSSNSGKLLGDYYLWNTIRRQAEKKEAEALMVLTENGLYNPDEMSAKPPGTYEGASSKMFYLSVVVTDKVRRFSKDRLVEVFEEKLKKYKVQAGSIRAWLEDSYVSEKPTLRKSITER